jgi:3-oxoacyl-[acyl-carrier protein] reductase
MGPGRVDGRVAVVTGAAGGLGSASATRLFEEGAFVALWDIDAARVRATTDELDPAGRSALAIVVDVGDAAAVEAAAQRTRETFGPIDILVNNAGVVDAVRPSDAAPPWEVTDESWRHHFRVNTDGTFYCVRACSPDMREQRYGKIVNIGWLGTQRGRPLTSPAYPASKGAVLGLTVTLARHLGEYGICVNAVNPGFISIGMYDELTPAEREALTADIPLNRRGKRGARGLPEDIAGAVLYLASSDSDFVTGEFLTVNGGAAA